MDKLKRVVIKEEFVAITDDVIEAIILNQMIYWSERVSDFDQFIKEENERQDKYCRPSQGEECNKQELLHGWIYKKAAELGDEIMSTDSEKTINRKLNHLVELGFLDRRNNPVIKYDRTYQYRVNFEKIIYELTIKGYVLQDYRVDLDMYRKPLETDKGQNDALKSQNDLLKRQIDELKSQLDALKSHSVGAIPETTSEITLETTTKDNKVPIPFQEIFNLYNEICNNLSKAKTLSDSRKLAIKRLWNKYPDIEQYKMLFEKTNTSNFLTGDNDRGWCADIDWLLKEANFIKVLEGKYENKEGRKTNQGYFNNFEQRQDKDPNYIDNIEKRLLGW